MKHYIARPHRLLSAKLNTSPPEFHLSRRLVPVNGCNLALLPDSLMLKSNFLLNFRRIHSNLHSGFVLVFCLSFFQKDRHSVMLHKRPFNQIEKQEEMTLYLPEPALSGSFRCCNFMYQLFRKVFCNIYLNPEIPKLQSLNRLFSTAYVVILEQLLVQKMLYFFVFEACDRHSLSRSFTNTHFPDHFLIAT